MSAHDIDYRSIPEHMQDGMRLYLEKGIPPGHFMTALLSNDLMGAMGRADDINRHRIFDLCAFLYNQAPIGSYGSPEKFDDWIKSGGLDGLASKPREEVQDA